MEQAVTNQKRIVTQSKTGKKPINNFWKVLNRDKFLYILVLPGLLYFLIFKYLPMWGILISFKDFQPFLGFFKSEWVGFMHFRNFFINPDFLKLLKNTLTLSALNLIIFFPMPIIISLLMNEVKNGSYKRFVQTMIYIPHFISMVIVASITYIVLNSETGVVNQLVRMFTGNSIDFLSKPEWFRPVILTQTVWKETGWGTIVILAALSNIDVTLYEAAVVDGAGRLRQLWHITLPSIKGTIIILLILRLGKVMDNGFEQLFLMTNALNRDVAEVFDTYVYYIGIGQGAFSYSSAVGLFKSLIGLVLVKTSDFLAKRAGESGIF